MCSKLFNLVTVFVGVSISIAGANTLNNVIPRDFFDTAESLLKDLSDVVESEISSATQTLTLLKAESAALANSVTSTTQLSIQGLSNHFTQEVNAIRREGLELGVDPIILAQCVSLYSTQLDYLYETVLREISICVTNTLYQSSEFITETLEQILNTRNIVTSFQLQIEQCQLIPNNNQCILNLISAISIELINLPSTIREDINKTKAVVKSLDATLNLCPEDRLNSITTIGNQVLVNLKSCANIPTIL